jgi:hypothetical protein
MDELAVGPMFRELPVPRTPQEIDERIRNKKKLFGGKNHV